MKPILPYMETSRLILREILRTDDVDLFNYAKLPNVGPLAGWKPHSNIEETREFITYAIRKKDYSQPGVYAIIYKENMRMIGTIEIHSYKDQKGAIGFVLHPKYWNKGIITEASKAVIIYGMEILELKRLEYCHFHHNLASKRVCEKLGFTFEGVLRNKYLLFDGSVYDDVVYSITDNDYKNDKLPWVKRFKKDLFIDY